MRNTKLLKKLTAVSLVLTMSLGSLAGCGKNDTATADVSVNATQPVMTEAVATQAPTKAEPGHENEARSFLTGMWIPKETANNTAVAVMYSNIADAMPQSSISYADVVMESLVEGGITRLCALFQNKTELVKIGPVRSCRLFYLFYAKEWEAAYVHYGYNILAEEYLKMDKMHALDGYYYCGFYRSTDRIAPHNAYTSWSGIMDSVAAKGIPQKYDAKFRSPLLFNTDDDKEIDLNKDAIARKCTKFYPGYPYNKPWFEFNEDTREYDRFQFGEAQIDKETGEQLSFKNILVKYVTGEYVDGTPDYKNSGEGMGLYITNGYALPITWWKLEDYGQTHYYKADGSELTINQGKTFICYIEAQNEGSVEIIGD